MLLGIALKNYKVYKNLQYIPISSGASFSAFLGPNGIGKTSIFEALDRFFNGGDWINNNETKKTTDDSAYVSPFFFIPINEITLSKKDRRIASILSGYFWDYTGPAYDPFIKSVIDNRIALASAGHSKDSHYLLLLGNTYLTNEIKIPFFENDIRKLFDEQSDIDFDDLKELLKK